MWCTWLTSPSCPNHGGLRDYQRGKKRVVCTESWKYETKQCLSSSFHETKHCPFHSMKQNTVFFIPWNKTLSVLFIPWNKNTVLFIPWNKTLSVSFHVPRLQHLQPQGVKAGVLTWSCGLQPPDTFSEDCSGMSPGCAQCQTPRTHPHWMEEGRRTAE